MMKNKPLREYSDKELDEMVEWASPQLREEDIPWEDLGHGDIVIFYPPRSWDTTNPWVVQVLRENGRSKIRWIYVNRGIISPTGYGGGVVVVQGWRRQGLGTSKRMTVSEMYESNKLWNNKYRKRWALWKVHPNSFMNWLDENPLSSSK